MKFEDSTPDRASSELTRRDWLRQMAALIGSLATAELVLAETQGRPPIELAIISDTHLGYRDQETARKQWAATAGELATCDAKFVLSYTATQSDDSALPTWLTFTAGTRFDECQRCLCGCGLRGKPRDSTGCLPVT